MIMIFFSSIFSSFHVASAFHGDAPAFVIKERATHWVRHYAFAFMVVSALTLIVAAVLWLTVYCRRLNSRLQSEDKDRALDKPELRMLRRTKLMLSIREHPRRFRRWRQFIHEKRRMMKERMEEQRDGKGGNDDIFSGVAVKVVQPINNNNFGSPPRPSSAPAFASSFLHHGRTSPGFTAGMRCGITSATMNDKAISSSSVPITEMISPEELIRFLRSSYLFFCADLRAMQLLIASAEYLNVGKNHVMFRAGDPVKRGGIYLLLKGSVIAYTTTLRPMASLQTFSSSSRGSFTINESTPNHNHSGKDVHHRCRRVILREYSQRAVVSSHLHVLAALSGERFTHTHTLQTTAEENHLMLLSPELIQQLTQLFPAIILRALRVIARRLHRVAYSVMHEHFGIPPGFLSTDAAHTPDISRNLHAELYPSLQRQTETKDETKQIGVNSLRPSILREDVSAEAILTFLTSTLGIDLTGNGNAPSLQFFPETETFIETNEHHSETATQTSHNIPPREADISVLRLHGDEILENVHNNHHRFALCIVFRGTLQICQRRIDHFSDNAPEHTISGRKTKGAEKTDAKTSSLPVHDKDKDKDEDIEVLSTIQRGAAWGLLTAQTGEHNTLFARRKRASNAKEASPVSSSEVDSSSSSPAAKDTPEEEEIASAIKSTETSEEENLRRHSDESGSGSIVVHAPQTPLASLSCSSLSSSSKAQTCKESDISEDQCDRNEDDDVVCILLSFRYCSRLFLRDPNWALRFGGILFRHCSELVRLFDVTLQTKAFEGGAALVHEGERSRGIFICVSGRIRLSQIVLTGNISRYRQPSQQRVRDGESVRVVGELGGGEAFGELEFFFTQRFRSTFRAVRQSFVLFVPRVGFYLLAEAWPFVTLYVNRSISRRPRLTWDKRGEQSAIANKVKNRSPSKFHFAAMNPARNMPMSTAMKMPMQTPTYSTNHVNTVAIIVVSAGAAKHLAYFSTSIAAALNATYAALHDVNVNTASPFVKLITADVVREEFGAPFFSSTYSSSSMFTHGDDASGNPTNAKDADAALPAMDAHDDITQWLADIEQRHEVVLLVAEYVSEWARVCVHHADVILLLARAGDKPNVSDIEKHFLIDPRTGESLLLARLEMVFIHPEDETEDVDDNAKEDNVTGIASSTSTFHSRRRKKKGSQRDTSSRRQRHCVRDGEEPLSFTNTDPNTKKVMNESDPDDSDTAADDDGSLRDAVASERIHSDLLGERCGSACARHWMRMRHIQRIHHVRIHARANAFFDRSFYLSDFHRLARWLSAQSVGLVLGGGGARGLAHLGVLMAMEDACIPVDVIGGTSQGAWMSAMYAMVHDPHRNMHVHVRLRQAVRHFAREMSSLWGKIKDLTLPLVSYFTGGSFNDLLIECFGETRMEDLWLPCFAVSTDLQWCREVIHTSGLVWRSLRCSMGLTGYLPPVCDVSYDRTRGEETVHYLIDGGYLNNLPADVMKEVKAAKTVLCVDVATEFRFGGANYGDTLSGFWLLLHKFVPSGWFSSSSRNKAMEEDEDEFRKQHGENNAQQAESIYSRFRLRLSSLSSSNESGNGMFDSSKVPGSAAIATQLAYVSTTQREPIIKKYYADLYIQPSVAQYGTLQYSKLKEIVEHGYQSGKQEIDKWKAELAARGDPRMRLFVPFPGR